MHRECGNEYFSKYNLRRHVESVHLKLKKFECGICKKVFSSKQNLKEHYFLHKGIQPFKCLTCNLSFRQASLLSLHKRVHKSQGVEPVLSKASVDHHKIEYKLVDEEFRNLEISLPKIDISRQVQNYF